MRRVRHLTQQQLASASGLGQPYISELETGRKRRPSGDALRGISRALGLSATEAEAFIAACEQSHASNAPPSPLVVDEQERRLHAVLMHVARGFDDFRDAMRQAAAELRAA
jgi:transcriptional regulator with XRE-family HTH domain